MNRPGDCIRMVGGVGVIGRHLGRSADEANSQLPSDLLSSVVVERILWRRSPLTVQRREGSPVARLFSTDFSVEVALSGDVIWGAGVSGKAIDRPMSDWPVLDVRAVRGPWTARLLSEAGLSVPSVFGDPVLLLAHLLPELGCWARSKSHGVLFVPDVDDQTSFERAEHTVLLPTEPVWTMLRSVARSAFVVGSSLHAVSVADALGIPARFVVPEGHDSFAYRDYLAGTGRPTTRIAASVEHALDLGPHRPPDVDLDALERAFPWNLWGLPADAASAEPNVFEPDAAQDAWLERITRGDGSRRAVRHFLEELVPQVRQAALDRDPELEAIVERARAYRAEVAPESTLVEVDEASQRLISAIDTGMTSLVCFAASLSASPALAMLRSSRVLGKYLAIAIAVHHPRTLATATSVELVLTGRSTGRLVRQPVALSESERVQWRVDLKVLIPTERLSPDDEWTLAVDLGGAVPVILDVLSVSPKALELLALERGDLPLSAPAAVIAKVDISTPEPSRAIREEPAPREMSRTILVFPYWMANPYINALYLASQAAGWNVTGVKRLDALVDAVHDQLIEGDVVHVHWTGPVTAGVTTRAEAEARVQTFGELLEWMAAKRIRVLWTVHNELAHDATFSDVERALAEKLTDHASLIIQLHEHTAEAVAGSYHLPPEKLVTLRHASYLGLYRDSVTEHEARERLGVPLGVPTVGFVGQVRPYKGLDTLFAAVDRAAAQLDGLTLLLAGKTSDRNLEALESALPTAAEIIRRGSFVPDDELVYWLKAADVMALPYRQVLNSGSAILAATFETPCILPADTPLTKVYRDESWFNTYDTHGDQVANLADAIVRVVRGDRRGHKEAARQFARAYTPFDMSRDYLRILDGLVTRAGGPGPTEPGPTF